MPWKFASFGVVVAAALLAGCGTKPMPAQDPGVTEEGRSSCNAAAANFAVGKKASPELLEQARIKAGAWSVRLLKPDTIVTLEYRSDRLNVNADDSATITRVNCG
ncbi:MULTISPECIES: I78 family peptidase inhibitor [unclassified Pseudomonas]|uniref:I78 family peptidase inhibitor n=1 Tax=unclassified Pseudomonas TaxID=196821 RepID=UPI002AC9A9D7|nr:MULTISPECIES: I78 family peptidase inhibitor [unclassified Pseudomonas]MEB0039854.1 I78 family peptidase inhibitor [Pseudomonas sp. MH10]MEB0077204.1 I78 family peptidase inhibitor [Pseudomonas sp. MH10out]MEB0091465.1 I78 family peptidase inhibitor [Pseudomonas sp. CCI4.2]MEB0101551.1 I78 family peptidase inhibitor [Pseudomonas sp. CCI3.2]MEB0120662.1 I78 family peptidase inhibitor [Pseudomonas sp. CCI1.2]